MTQTITENLTTLVHELLPGAKIIKLRGFSRKNIDYSKAKTPPYNYKWKEEAGLTEEELHSWLDQNGWIGAVIPKDRIILDIDDTQQGELVKNLLEGENVHHHCIKSPNGWQFIFEATNKETKKIKQIAKYYSQVGAVIDTRTAEAGYIVFPTKNTEERYIVTKSLQRLDNLPIYLAPVKNSKFLKDYEFTIPIESGSRNDTLYKFATHLRAWNVPNEQISKAMELIYEYFVPDKTDFSPREIQSLVRSALNWEMEPSKAQNNGFNQEEIEENYTPNVIIPIPYQVVNNQLIRTETKVVGGDITEKKEMVSRLAPRLIKELSNIERNSLHYEIAWIDRGREKREIVPASTLATKKDLLLLADYGLPCNDLNYKRFIDYFDKYLALNQLPQSKMVERLGHIKDLFIHPLATDGVEIVPADSGEKQLLEAFSTKGDSYSWINEVFERIKDQPKVLFMVLASFTSVVLQDLKISPFIVDLSGSTSQGKTTALQVARSVWGTEELINEWNATKVAIERKAGFLNSFPFFLDDTRKANEKLLQSIVYQFSGGRAKGRGSLKGAQKELTWNNILISTGEVSLVDYASKAGGVAARIISLVDQPFENVESDYFSDLYQAIEKYQGTIGLDFLKKWQVNKENFISEFYKFKDMYLSKSKGNEVLTRLSMYYAAVHFTGSVIKKLFKLNVDLKIIYQLFDEMARENKTLDKPKQLLEEILLELDSSRKYIYYTRYLPNEMRAIYKFDTICLTPSYLKEYLGTEEKMIRKEWIKRKFTIPYEQNGKLVDYKLVKHEGSSFRVVMVNKEFIEQLDLDFSERML
jgi:putative DNA primase/helicase